MTPCPLRARIAAPGLYGWPALREDLSTASDEFYGTFDEIWHPEDCGGIPVHLGDPCYRLTTNGRPDRALYSIDPGDGTRLFAWLDSDLVTEEA